MTRNQLVRGLAAALARETGRPIVDQNSQTIVTHTGGRTRLKQYLELGNGELHISSGSVELPPPARRPAAPTRQAAYERGLTTYRADQESVPVPPPILLAQQASATPAAGCRCPTTGSCQCAAAPPEPPAILLAHAGRSAPAAHQDTVPEPPAILLTKKGTV